MLRKTLTLFVFFFFSFFSLSLLHLALPAQAKASRFGDFEDVWDDECFRPLVKRTERKLLAENEHGQITAVNIRDGIRGPYHIQFFTLVPNSLFLPVLLHADMLLYVHTGSGRLSFADEEETRSVHLRRGDIFRLQTGSVFFVQSDLEPQRESLRIYALFSNTDDELFEPAIGAYSSISNLVRGFDKVTLKQAFKVPDEVIESITSATNAEAIVRAISTKKDKKEKKKKAIMWEMEARFLKAFLEGKEAEAYNKKKSRGYNLLDEEPDFENCNGWSLTVNSKKAEHMLQATNIGLFMVNLTKGSMMGPHWNPRATEIAIVLHGQGMVRVICSSKLNKSKQECKNMRFRVKEGDVFTVPRFHPMAQISFNNDSLVFMGFATAKEENHPQFLAGKQSVLQTLDRDILALSFSVSNTTIDQLLAAQADSTILDCTSCAEEEERIMEEEIEKEKEEEQARKREREEEERRKREEEERKREEEEKRREEEEIRKRQEEEERKRQEEEERKRREEEEARKREEEEQERERQRQEEERRREEEKQRQKEEGRERQEEEERRQEEDRQRQEAEEQERQREEEERRQEEERQRQEDEEKERQQEERRQEEERQRQEEEWRREVERQRQEDEERERQRQEEERQREKEEARRRREDWEKERQLQGST